MKKGLLITILLSAFIIGMALGSAPAPTATPAPAPPQPQSQLEQAIAIYEEAVAEGREFVPYSQQVQQAAAPDGMGDNAVGRLGQGIGSFLQTLVRELLRSIVRVFDELLTA